MAPSALNWTDEEAVDDIPEEPPSSEVNVDLVEDVEEEIILGGNDFDQGIPS